MKTHQKPYLFFLKEYIFNHSLYSISLWWRFRLANIYQRGTGCFFKLCSNMLWYWWAKVDTQLLKWILLNLFLSFVVGGDVVFEILCLNFDLCSMGYDFSNWFDWVMILCKGIMYYLYAFRTKHLVTVWDITLIFTS